MQQTAIFEASGQDKHRFILLQLLRSLFVITLCFFLHYSLNLKLSVFSLCFSGLLGVYLSGSLLKRNLSLLKTIIIHLLIFALCAFFLSVASILLSSSQQTPRDFDFILDRISDRLFFLCLVYSIAYITTYFFWTSYHALTFEILLAAASLSMLLSGHRNYHIDAPKQISSLSWKVPLLQSLHAQPQHIFIAISSAFSVLFLAYIYLSNSRPLFSKQLHIINKGKSSSLLFLLMIALLAFSLAYYSLWLNNLYSENLTRVTNGVGLAPVKEGESNLGFQSAISPTQQPAALLRFETDYPKNPWYPMLYLREGALSEFNGKEIVTASDEYDTDVPRVGVGKTFLSDKTNELDSNRKEVLYSVYLLVKHKAPFTIDYPKKISILKNPEPNKFISAYQALSLAPIADLNVLRDAKVGSSAWSSETWKHYLKAPGSESQIQEDISSFNFEKEHLNSKREDLRYRALAQKLTQNMTNNIQKAAAIIKYLSEQSIYTRAPGYTISPEGDPVAPYLFSEKKKGYCVHFSHAAVYLMRLLEIPARIGTGYLTDLTYSKDGHVLLLLGDRHAWAEVYIEGQGWMVFDVSPSQAENEQVLVPDRKLLEELMSKLDPSQLLLEPEPTKERTTLTEQLIQIHIRPHHLYLTFFLILFLYLSLKASLRYSWLVTRDGRKKTIRAYVSFASKMADIKKYRNYAETRNEYAVRLKQELSIDATAITKLNEAATYAHKEPQTNAQELSLALAKSDLALGNHKFVRILKKLLAFFSPFSLLRIGSW